MFLFVCFKKPEENGQKRWQGTTNATKIGLGDANQIKSMLLFEVSNQPQPSLVWFGNVVKSKFELLFGFPLHFNNSTSRPTTLGSSYS